MTTEHKAKLSGMIFFHETSGNKQTAHYLRLTIKLLDERDELIEGLTLIRDSRHRDAITLRGIADHVLSGHRASSRVTAALDSLEGT